MDGACDRESLARDAIFKSLVDIGRRKFSSVLEITHGYLTKHNKVQEQHITNMATAIVVFTVMCIAFPYSWVANIVSFF